MRVLTKYKNRKIYDKSISRYVTLKDIAYFLKTEEIKVIDFTTKKDITQNLLIEVLTHKLKNSNINTNHVLDLIDTVQ